MLYHTLLLAALTLALVLVQCSPSSNVTEQGVWLTDSILTHDPAGTLIHKTFFKRDTSAVLRLDYAPLDPHSNALSLAKREITVYDAMGNPTNVMNFTADGEMISVVNWLRDADGRTLRKDIQSKNSAMVISQTFNEKGQLVIRDKVDMRYSGVSNGPQSVPESQTTELSYDDNGRLVSKVVTNGYCYLNKVVYSYESQADGTEKVTANTYHFTSQGQWLLTSRDVTVTAPNGHILSHQFTTESSAEANSLQNASDSTASNVQYRFVYDYAPSDSLQSLTHFSHFQNEWRADTVSHFAYTQSQASAKVSMLMTTESVYHIFSPDSLTLVRQISTYRSCRSLGGKK